MKLRGNIVDIPNRQIFSGELVIEGGLIKHIRKLDKTLQNYIIPGFIDAHIHIESSMLVPSQFAKIAVKHGTVATVSDPHEIANVLGIEGVDYMLENASSVPLKFNFGAPSCVPATSFETAGAIIDPDDIFNLLKRNEIKYLSEMMNYPGVLYDDQQVLQKLKHARDLNKPIDGHAPGLRGELLDKYIKAGISTDHECFTYEEAYEKLSKGMKILIREGSAAKNFEALIDLLPEYYERIMFCSDDKHPDDLLLGHINDLCKRAVEKGVDVFKVLQAACLNPIEHYNLDVGTLKEGDKADLAIVEDLVSFKVIQTYIEGRMVYGNGEATFNAPIAVHVNNFDCNLTRPDDFKIRPKSDTIRIIEALDGELITKESIGTVKLSDNNCISNADDDILKMAVVNRYNANNDMSIKPAIGFIKNFGLKKGAIASSVAHDSHNIIAVGTSDTELSKAINVIIENKGGICTVNKDVIKVLPLPIAGLMSDKTPEFVAKKYEELDVEVKRLGSALKAPFMTLSFMALLVIPSLKLSDKGLFDGDRFKFVTIES